VDNEFYVPTTERWQIEKGHLYEYNKKITYMNTSLRSLFLLHHFGIKLTQDEYLAIYLHDGQYIDKNKDYSLKEPNLSLIIHQADVAAGVVELCNQGLAVSDSFRRRFGKWHHLVDMGARKSIETIVGCAAVAPDAWAADCMTSGLFFAPPEQYLALAHSLAATYLVFRADGQTIVSPDWIGELY
jgi:hypothetical protein